MALSPSAQRVQDALIAHGGTHQVVETVQTTRSAAEAAAAIGCEVGQIVKSLVFRRKPDGRPVLIVASGVNRVNEARVSEHLGVPIERPGARYVRDETGFAIGGVPPLGHNTPLETLVDEDLAHYAEIWAAAGTPNAVFQLTFADLVAFTAGRIVNIK